jgi:hypothetical protein
MERILPIGHGEKDTFNWPLGQRQDVPIGHGRIRKRQLAIRDSPNWPWEKDNFNRPLGQRQDVPIGHGRIREHQLAIRKKTKTFQLGHGTKLQLTKLDPLAWPKKTLCFVHMKTIQMTKC